MSLPSIRYKQAVALQSGDGPVILLDVSSSMDNPAGGRRRIDRLAEVLRQVLPHAPNARLLAFSDRVEVIEDPEHLPEPNGGTRLDAALMHAATLRPKRLVVISDGEPSDAPAALRAAHALTCTIDAFHVGDEDNRAAFAFMRALTKCGRGLGRAAVADLTDPTRLVHELRQALLLAGPR
jgi:hypothetical protein